MSQDKYLILFFRDNGDDVDAAKGNFPNLSMHAALMNQIAAELMEGYDRGVLAGSFKMLAATVDGVDYTGTEIDLNPAILDRDNGKADKREPTDVQIAQKHVTEQEAWIERCGGTLEGYIKNYGSPSAPDFKRYPDGYYGNGGEAIFAADMKYLSDLKARLAALQTGALVDMVMTATG